MTEPIKIVVKLGDLIAAHAALSEMGGMQGIPQKTAYRLARVIRKAGDDVKTYNERRLAIMKDTGKLEAHPGIPGQFWLDPKKLTLEDNDKLKAAFDELDAVEVDFETMPIKLGDFGERFDLRPNWLASLYWLIEE